MAQQQHEGEPAAATADWVQQMRSFNSDDLAAAMNELGLQNVSNMDQVAATVSALVAQLSSPDTQKQDHAVRLLMRLSSSSSNSAAIVAAGAIPALVPLLRSNEPGVQRSAATTLLQLAYGSSDDKAAIISAGAIPVLEQLCDSSSKPVQLQAAIILCNLASASSHSETLLATRALPTLVRILTSCSTSSNAGLCDIKGDTTQAINVGTVSEASTQATSTAIVNKDATEAAVQDDSSSRSAATTAEAQRGAPSIQGDLGLLDQQSLTQIAALGVLKESLCNTSYRPGVVLSLQLAAGVPKALVTVLETANSAVQFGAAELLCGMMQMKGGTATTIAAAGAIPALLPLLQHSEERVWRVAAEALFLLTAGHTGSQAAFVAAGGMGVLVTLMAVQSKQQHAVGLLDELVHGSSAAGSSSILSAAVAAGVVVPLVQLLRSSNISNKVPALSVLSELAKGGSCRMAIVAAGVLPALIAMLQDRDMRTAYNAAVVLMDLTQKSSSNKTALAAAGGIEAIINATGSTEPELQSISCALLFMMINHNSSCQSAAIAAGAIPAIVSVLKGNNVHAQIEAAGALAHLALPDIAAAMGAMSTQEGSRGTAPSHKGAWHAAAEAVPVLVSLLNHQHPVLQQRAAVALGNLFNKSSAVADAFAAVNGSAAVMSMVDSPNPVVKHAAMMLVQIMADSTREKKME